MKTITEFPNYKIDENGIVYSKRKGYRTEAGKWVTKENWKPLKSVLDKGVGYYLVTLIKYEKDTRIKKNRFIHRLLGQYYLDNPYNKAHINHIDGIKTNNTLSNLEWATEQENTQHAVDNKLMTHEHSEKEVHQYTLSGKYIQSFISDTTAERITDVAKQNISKVTLSKRDQAGGYQWSRNKLNRLPTICNKKIINNITITSIKTHKVIEFTKKKDAANYLRVSGTTLSKYAKQNKPLNNHYIKYNYFE